METKSKIIASVTGITFVIASLAIFYYYGAIKPEAPTISILEVDMVYNANNTLTASPSISVVLRPKVSASSDTHTLFLYNLTLGAFYRDIPITDPSKLMKSTYPNPDRSVLVWDPTLHALTGNGAYVPMEVATSFYKDVRAGTIMVDFKIVSQLTWERRFRAGGEYHLTAACPVPIQFPPAGNNTTSTTVVGHLMSTIYCVVHV